MSGRGQISVLAAWCETDSHLLVPVDPPSLAAQRVCDILAGSGWNPSQRLSEDLRNRIEAAAQYSDRPNGSVADLGPPLTNAEISQRSVDVLLREYYNMMQALQQAAQHTSDSGSSALQRAFLLLCPVMPCCLDLQHLVAAAVKLTQIASRLVMLLSCLIIPLWLAAIRELIQHHHQHQQATTLALAGLASFLLADVIHRHTDKARRASAGKVVTAATVRQSHASAGGTSVELLALRQASKTATTSNSSKQTLAQQQLQQLQIQQQPAGGAAAGSNGQGAASPTSGVSHSGPSYLELLPALAALQSAVGIPGTAGSVNSKDKLAEELGRVCSIMGVAITPDMTASATAMAATIAQLKSSIGI